MYELLEKVNTFDKEEFDEILPELSAFVLQVALSGTNEEVLEIAKLILEIESPQKYVYFVENLYTTNPGAYLKLNQKVPQIGIRRRAIYE